MKYIGKYKSDAYQFRLPFEFSLHHKYARCLVPYSNIENQPPMLIRTVYRELNKRWPFGFVSLGVYCLDNIHLFSVFKKKEGKEII